MRRIAFVATLTLLALAAAPHAQTSTWRPVVLSDTGMIASGQHECLIVGGVESMTRVPMGWMCIGFGQGIGTIVERL